MVTSLKRDGKNFVGEAKVMSTPMGKIVSNIMDDGGKLAVSSRGMGSLQQKNGANYVNKDFYLQPLPILSQTHLHLRGLYKVLWKVKNGFGTMGYLKK